MTLAHPIIVQRSPEWHVWRLAHVTATDAAIIAGETGSVVELWGQKLGAVDERVMDDESRAAMDEGLAIQPYLLDYHRRRTGLDTRAVDGVREAEDWPVAACSPDGEVEGEPIGVEVKMTTSPRWPEAYRMGDPVPGDVLAQVQWQMRVTGWERVDVVALLFGRPKIIEVERDQDYIDDLDFLCRRFWGWVENRERPPVDGSETTRRALSQLHPRNDDAGLLEADAEVEAVVRGLAVAKKIAKVQEDEVATLENTIRALIGDADGYRGSFGKVTWKRNKDSTRTNWPAVAKAFREMVDETPEVLDAIESLHSATVPGPRVLKLSLKGEEE